METITKKLIFNGFTPSEMLLINGEQLDTPPIERESQEKITLLDGTSKAPVISLALQYIQVAILANVEAGVIQLSIKQNAEDNTSQLMCVPTGEKYPWSPYTLESRLLFDEEADVQSVVGAWLKEESNDAYKQVIELGKIMMVIRGHANVIENDWGVTKILLTSKKTKTASAEFISNAKELIQKFAQQHPLENKMMLEAITTALMDLTHVRQEHDSFKLIEPWAAELPEDQEKYRVIKTSEYEKHSPVLNYPPVKWLIKTVWPLIFKGIIILIALSVIAFGGYSFYHYLKTTLLGRIVFIAVFIGIILLVIYLSIQKKMAATISKEVAGKPETIAPVTNDVVLQNEVPLPVEPLSEKLTDTAPAIKINLITIDSFPTVPENIQQLMTQASMRKPAVKKMYLRLILILGIATLLLHGCYFLLHYLNKSEKLDRGDFSGLGLLAEFVIMGMIAGPILAKNGVDVDIENFGKFKINIPYSIRAKRLAAAGLLFSLVPLIDLHFFYLRSSNLIYRIVFSAIAIGILGVYFYQVYKNRRKIEQLYPYHPPFNLLALRVFGSNHMGNFLNLVQGWHYHGTMNRLDGPDTVGWKFSDMIHFAEKKLERSIVKDDNELETGLKKCRYTPDANLRFSVNSMQCTNATWKKAIQYMFNKADVIVLDLSNLSEKNQGVSYEITKLFNEIPKNKFLLLVDNSTDMQVLQKILANICNNLAPTSPNTKTDFENIDVFDTGGMPVKEEKESAFDFKKRVNKRLDSDKLLGLLLDKCITNSTIPQADPIKDAPYVYWTGLRFSYNTRRIWNYCMIAVLILLVCLCFF